VGGALGGILQKSLYENHLKKFCKIPPPTATTATQPRFRRRTETNVPREKQSSLEKGISTAIL
jgi:hypothetical protein